MLPKPKTLPRGLDVPALAVPYAGGEQLVGVQQQAIVDWKVEMRYRSDVKETMRIIHEGRTLNIVRAVDEDGRRRELVCYCKEQR